MDVRRYSPCEQAQRLASLRLDGELTPFEGVLLERHLADCSACCFLATETEAITRAVRAAPPVTPGRPVVVQRRPQRLLPLVAAASAVAAALAVGLAGPTSRTITRSHPNAGVGAFDVDRDLRDLRREQLKPPPVHLPGARSLLVV